MVFEVKPTPSTTVELIATVRSDDRNFVLVGRAAETLHKEKIKRTAKNRILALFIANSFKPGGRRAGPPPVFQFPRASARRKRRSSSCRWWIKPKPRPAYRRG